MIASILHFALLVSVFFLNLFQPAAGQCPDVTAAMMKRNRSRLKLFLRKSEGREFSPNLNGHLSLLEVNAN